MSACSFDAAERYTLSTFVFKVEGEFSVCKMFFLIIDENDSLSEYNKIPLGPNRTNGAVYSKIYFKVEICSAH